MEAAAAPLPPAALPAPRARAADRVLSLVEVAFCSGLPTQLAIMLALAAVGLEPLARDGGLSLQYVTLLSLADTALLTGLVLAFLRARGDSPRRLFLGTRAAVREARLGLLVLPAVLVAVVALSLLIQATAPWLHNVPRNPLASLFRNGRDVAIFAIVAMIAGGAREEVQRAFILDRFERHLGGATVGLIVFSALFGLGHLLQGYDAALVTGVLGLAWGLLFLWRRSVVAPMVCHAMFNLAQVLYHALAA